MLFHLFIKEFATTIITLSHPMLSIVMGCSLVEFFHLRICPILLTLDKFFVFCTEEWHWSAISFIFMFAKLIILKFFNAFWIMYLEAFSAKTLSTDATCIYLYLQTKVLGILIGWSRIFYFYSPVPFLSQPFKWAGRL